MAPAICARLGIAAERLRGFQIYRRGNDARRKNAILLVYTIDADVADEAEVLARLAGDKDVRPTPDMAYRFVAHAPDGWSGLRPVVVGAGPCGLFAGLILAQMGFRPIILDRGKIVRERTKDTWVCGAGPNSIPIPTCSSARVGRAPFPTASSIAG